MSDLVEYSAVSRLSGRLRLARQMAPQRIDKWLHEEVGPALRDEMIARAPEASGNLKSKITMIPEPGGIRVGTVGVGYTKYVVKGTEAHEIKPKNSSVLVFKVGGKTVYARTVKHPGTQPNTFMQDSVRVVTRRMLPRLSGLVFDLGAR